MQKDKFFLPTLLPIAALARNRSDMLIIYYKIEYIAAVCPRNRNNILNFANIK